MFIEIEDKLLNTDKVTMVKTRTIGMALVGWFDEGIFVYLDSTVGEENILVFEKTTLEDFYNLVNSK